MIVLGSIIFGLGVAGLIYRKGTHHEIKDLEAGEVPGMTTLDARAALEVQAEDMMRGYAQKTTWWELEEEIKEQ